MLVILQLEIVTKSWSIFNTEGALLVKAETVQLADATVDEQGIHGELIAISGYDFPPPSNQIREYMNHRRHNFSYPSPLRPATYNDSALWDKKTKAKLGKAKTLILEHSKILYKE